MCVVFACGVQGEVEGCHSQAECQELGIDQHKLLEMLKDKGSEFVYDDINDDDEDDDDVDGEESEEEEEATDIDCKLRKLQLCIFTYTYKKQTTVSQVPLQFQKAMQTICSLPFERHHLYRCVSTRLHSLIHR